MTDPTIAADNLRNNKEATVGSGVVEYKSEDTTERQEDNRKITAYLAAPVRGKDGDAVDPKAKWDNVQKAIQIGNAIRMAFSSLDLFCPHEHEIIIDRLWRNGLPTKDIVEATAQEATARDFMLVYEGDGISAGMRREIEVVTEAGKPIVYFDRWDEVAKVKAAEIMASLI